MQMTKAASIPVVRPIDDDPYQISTHTVTLTHTPIAVTPATTVVLAANAARKYLLLVNDSDTTIYVMFGAAAVLNQGIRINANGGSFCLECTAISTGAINAIQGAAVNKNLLATEGV